ncbi:MAG TPA: ATP-binding cassette domain-containing protein [Thermoanaerobaculia bacterium]|jgi:phosphate transport system ATP-binding protein|nr:ATP-binding cassette domain-containing protein [Thermoanaerobaculia bacterium]
MLDFAPRRETLTAEPVLETRGLSVSTHRRLLLRAVDLRLEPRQVLGILGPSGAGKTTLLRCLNRLIDLTPQLAVSGEVLLHGRSIYGRGVDADALRARVGMIFQQPVVFPGSIADNVLFGVRHTRRLPRRAWPERIETALREAALWGEVRHRLREPAASLSVGQQQRLCLARALAGEPEILLLDEPTSALDAVSTAAIEELILRLRERHAIVLVTHNLQQARRVADSLTFLESA